MKIKPIIAIMLSAFWGAAVAAQQPRAAGGGFLWQIEKDFRVNYILGSVRLFAQKGLYPLRPRIEEAFKQSGLLAVKAEIDPQQIQKATLTLLQRGMYIGEDRLKNHVSAITLAAVEKQMQKINKAIETVDKCKPWLVGLFIVADRMTANTRLREQYLTDYFRERAKGQKELVLINRRQNMSLGLFNLGIDFLSGLPESQSESMLLDCLDLVERCAERDEQLLQIWQSADARAMEAWSAGESKKFPVLRMLRQKSMSRTAAATLAQLVSLLQSGKKCFIIFGTEQLLGADGILQQLQQQGYRCSQI